jgi:hypothetical protein
MLNIPTGPNPTRMITRDIFRGGFVVADLRPLQADAIRKQLSQINERLRIIVADAGAEIIDPVDFFMQTIQVSCDYQKWGSDI